MAETTSKPNVALVLRHYEDFIDRGDLGAADRDLRPDFVDHAAPVGTSPGPDSAKAWITMFRAAFPDIQVQHEQVIANGQLVGVLARWHGTHAGPFFGMEPTGRTVEMRGMVPWRVADGQPAETLGCPRVRPCRAIQADRRRYRWSA